MNDTNLESKETNYDAFNSLKISIQNEPSRHILEGAAIIGSPVIASTKGIILDPNDINDSRYKLHLATIVRDILMDHSNNPSMPETSVEELLMMSMVFDNLPYRRAGLSLPLITSKVHSRMGEKGKVTLCEKLGKEVEVRFRKFYENRGYETDSEKRNPDVRKYLRSEYDFFTRITSKVFQKLS